MIEGHRNFAESETNRIDKNDNNWMDKCRRTDWTDRTESS